MNIIDTIKDFENVGFNRKQAEMQVRSMVSIKDGLATKDDINGLNNRFDSIDRQFELMDRKFDLIDRKFNLIAEEFDHVNSQFEFINKRFTHLESKIDFIPFQTTVYQAGVLLVFFGLYQAWPAIFTWLTK